MTSIVRCLEDKSPAIREAACHSTRALSRSAKNLRTHLVDAGIALPLLNVQFHSFFQKLKFFPLK